MSDVDQLKNLIDNVVWHGKDLCKHQYDPGAWERFELACEAYLTARDRICLQKHTEPPMEEGEYYIAAKPGLHGGAIRSLYTVANLMKSWPGEYVALGPIPKQN